jgi:hypothetical protein
MKEIEYIDATDLRSYRSMTSILNWVQPSAAQKEILMLVYAEITRLEPKVEEHMDVT